MTELERETGSLLMTTLWTVLRCTRPVSDSSTSLVKGFETELLMNHEGCLSLGQFFLFFLQLLLVCVAWIFRHLYNINYWFCRFYLQNICVNNCVIV